MDSQKNDNKFQNGKVKFGDDLQDDSETEFKCGYFGWTPAWLQKFATPPWLLVSIMWFVFVQGFTINGVKNVNTSTLERRFALTSTEVAWISSSYDVAAGFLSIIFGYLGTFVNKSRIIAISAFVMGCGSLTMSLPHFIDGNYEIGIRDSELCDLSGNSSQCDSGDSPASQRSYLGVFILGQVMHAVGGSAVYTLSVPLLDENVRRKDSAYYIGCMLACSVLGPGFGFLAGGLLLNIYVDAGRVDMDEVPIEPGDPRWVGAWWIGFMAGGLAAMTVALFCACFPSELPVAATYRKDRESEAHAGFGEKESAVEGFGKRPEDILVLLKCLIVNPVWVLSTMVGILEYALIMGFAVFLPKIIQFQFAQSLAMAAVWAGLTVMPAATFGHLLGGLIPKWLNLKVKGMIKQGIFFCVLALLLVFQFLLKCDMPIIAGISVPYENRTLDFDGSNAEVSHPCNQNCSCTTISYDPTCGQNGVTYFTPCHAGCLNSTEVDGDEVYNDCSCIAMEHSVDPTMPEATAGICGTECDVLPYFLVLFLLINLCTFIPATAGQALIIRVVPDKQRSFAFGLQQTIIRFVGQVPGPLIFGAIFDSSCWLWQEQCGERGSCWIYSTDALAYGFTLLGIVFKSVSLVCSTSCLFLYKPPPPEVEETPIGAKEKEANNTNTKRSNDNLDSEFIYEKQGIGINPDGYVNEAYFSQEQLDSIRNGELINEEGSTAL